MLSRKEYILFENKNMAGRDIITIGASAGGVETLIQIVRSLPKDLPAAIFIVLHVSPDSTSLLPQILNRRSSLPAFHAKDGEEIQHGRIYVAPPDRHLLVKLGKIGVAHGPKENRHRPAVDPLFRTAARAYGPRVVGVVLSGTLDDGTAGLSAVKSRGGVAIVQDPEEALYDGMPRNAIENVQVDYILPVSEIVSTLVNLASKPVEELPKEEDTQLAIESDMAELDMGAVQNLDRPGKESPYGCPECGGVLWEIKNFNLLRFRCRTGHAFSAQTLLAEQSETLEQALWVALRALKEKSALARRLADKAKTNNHRITASRFELQVQDAELHAEVIRQVLLKDGSSATVEEAARQAIELNKNIASEEEEDWSELA